MRSSLKPADDLALLEPLAAAVVQVLPIEMMPLGVAPLAIGRSTWRATLEILSRPK
jgi:hypothetical protein